MKLNPAQLEAHLTDPLASLYLVTGDEPLQLIETTDAIRHTARQQGYSERVVFTVEAGFEWEKLTQQANHLSLFANRQLLELRLGSKALGNAGEKAIIHYAEHPPTDTLLLISADKLDKSKQKSKWFNTIEKQGVVIQVRPLESHALPTWIKKRLAKQGLQAEPAVIQLIADRSEGHLLACAQEIEKLSLLHGKGVVTLDSAQHAVADSARFAVFDWVDTVLRGQPLRVVRQLHRLRTEGVEVILVAWALTQQVRILAHVAYALQAGQPEQQALNQRGIWPQRRPLVLQAANRHALNAWYTFLRTTSLIDRQIKGAATGNPWDSLQQLSLHIADPVHRSKYLSLSLTPAHSS